ncbi:MAG: beta-lactamase family protein [Fidelibacterota bacterium]|nr:MAG: beta-lactamase family protein [Candidatus Neomarinimicrobiota bacterium]
MYSRVSRIVPFISRTVFLFIPFTYAFGQDTPEPLLRHIEPLDAVVADLRDYIPARMADDHVPGLSIALVREGKVVWSEGFGVANQWTGRPVTPETAFEVASISKVVTAYVALRLVEQGQLALDEPLIGQLDEPWLPPSEWGDKITLRHLAGHSSGLSDNLLPMDKSLQFEPGTGFLYSGIGAQYIQAAVEQVTGQSLETAARELALEPLGMTASSFVTTPDIRSHLANGHLGYGIPLLLFLMPFVMALVVIMIVLVMILRIRTGRWRVSVNQWALVLVAAGLLAILLLVWIMGPPLPNFVLLITLAGLGFAAVLALVILIGRQTLLRLFSRWRGSGLYRFLICAVLITIAALVLIQLAMMISGPKPRFISPKPGAVGSLRSSAPDLARLLIELSQPQYLSPEMAEQIRTPQTPIDDNFSWGLGPGIQHSAQGDALWQNGITFGYRSLMAVYPELGMGVVVLTNSDGGYDVACDVAQRALGGKSTWKTF